MSVGLPGGNSFMEDYTYDLGEAAGVGDMRVLGAHMLEICPSISSEKPQVAIHPLGIGGKDDPVRMIFNADSGAALNVSLIDMGNRFRLLVNEVDACSQCRTSLSLVMANPICQSPPQHGFGAGGAHHTVYSKPHHRPLGRLGRYAGLRTTIN